MSYEFKDQFKELYCFMIWSVNGDRSNTYWEEICAEASNLANKYNDDAFFKQLIYDYLWAVDERAITEKQTGPIVENLGKGCLLNQVTSAFYLFVVKWKDLPYNDIFESECAGFDTKDYMFARSWVESFKKTKKAAIAA